MCSELTESGDLGNVWNPEISVSSLVFCSSPEISGFAKRESISLSGDPVYFPDEPKAGIYNWRGI